MYEFVYETKAMGGQYITFYKYGGRLKGIRNYTYIETMEGDKKMKMIMYEE